MILVFVINGEIILFGFEVIAYDVEEILIEIIVKSILSERVLNII